MLEINLNDPAGYDYAQNLLSFDIVPNSNILQYCNGKIYKTSPGKISYHSDQLIFSTTIEFADRFFLIPAAGISDYSPGSLVSDAAIERKGLFIRVWCIAHSIGLPITKGEIKGVSVYRGRIDYAYRPTVIPGLKEHNWIPYN